MHHPLASGQKPPLFRPIQIDWLYIRTIKDNALSRGALFAFHRPVWCGRYIQKSAAPINYDLK